MACIQWGTAWLEPGGGCREALLVIDVDTDADDDARGWQDEFNRRAKVQFVNTEGPSPWGAIHCVDGVLVVAEMQTRALPELEDFLSSIWP